MAGTCRECRWIEILISASMISSSYRYNLGETGREHFVLTASEEFVSQYSILGSGQFQSPTLLSYLSTGSFMERCLRFKPDRDRSPEFLDQGLVEELKVWPLDTTGSVQPTGDMAVDQSIHCLSRPSFVSLRTFSAHFDK